MFMAAFHRELFLGSAATAKGFGLTMSDLKLDWPTLTAHVAAEVKRLNGVYPRGWKAKGITVLEGKASFKNKNTVEIQAADGTVSQVTGKHIAIAVGGVPTCPDVPGAREYGTNSDGFFDIHEQPKKALVIGGGYIAVEMAGILHALGTDTSLSFRGETVLRRGFDKFIVETLMDNLEKHGPTLLSKTEVAKVELAGDGTKTVTFKDGSLVEGLDLVLFAIGRTPNTSTLGLDTIGVKTNRKGQVVVDEYENSSIANVYALGDVTQTGFELTPVAIAAGRRLGDRLFGGEAKARIPYSMIPTVVFSHPTIGTIGLTQGQAETRFGAENVRVKQARFRCMFYAFNENNDKKVTTALKLVMTGPEERIVGLHMIGPSSDEMLQGFAVAVRMGATRRDFEATCAIHPTIGEEMVTFGGWGQTTDGKPLLPYNLDPLGDRKKAISPAPASSPPSPSPSLAPESAPAASAPASAPATSSWLGIVTAFLAGAAITAMVLKTNKR
jgi:glutathione reductase (NADPH)